MSDNDRERSADEATRLAREAMTAITEAASRQQDQPAAHVRSRARRRISLIALAVGVPILGVLIFANLSDRGLSGLVGPRVSDAERRQRLLEAVNFVVLEIEAFREDYDELPEDLAEVAAPIAGRWRYEAVGTDHYRVEASAQGWSIVYNSTQDPEAFFEELRRP